ncbi:uncharacterized protein LOC136036698 [Artemia franciscana]|uniref:Small ribosomal subunit protein uS10 domain-containing protein n=2 Tax=Artemia franciscana TaxID=6661 RepID=A0AA88HZ16_ARTSF|nr:hypothetical protein QYM36_004573 [Artemia franciscana]KAK2720730.1 hypothetical protein QYM36_004573 [Artemia franciscana]
MNRMLWLCQLCKEQGIHRILPHQLELSFYKMFKQMLSHFVKAQSRQFSPCLVKSQKPDYFNSIYPVESYTGILNIQLKSYDFTVLERFSSFVHRISENIGVDVLDVWATPSKAIDVVTFQKNSHIQQDKYHLKEYERNVQIDSIPASLLSVLMEVIHTSLPESVKLSIHSHEHQYDEIRFVPDLELKALRQELDEITSAKNK